MVGDYDTIANLCRENNFKKIMVIRNSWEYGNWCIVNKVIFKEDKRYCNACGHINYKNGNKINGLIEGASTYSWKLIKVLDEEMDIEYSKNS